jgi:outer membrane protein TolC
MAVCGLLGLAGCANDRAPKQDFSKLPHAEPSATAAFAQTKGVPPIPPLPTIVSVPAITQVAFQQPASASAANAPTQEVIQKPTADPIQPTAQANEPFLVDLPTVLRLADADNLQVGIARLQINQALARQQRAEALWLPSIRAGANYNRHDGAIQDVVGNQFDTNRGAYFSGLGAGVFGAGGPMVPGVLAQFHLTDALFQPLAARQAVGARSQGAAAVRHDVLLRVALAHQELLRAAQEHAIARETLAQAQQLATLTGEFARVGQGAAADADRAATELSVRQIEVFRTEESLRVAGARLAQLLRLDSNLYLLPAEPMVVPLDFVEVNADLRELTALGLSQRPELAEQRYLVGEAVMRLRREKYAPLIPSVLVGASYGGFGAGINGDFASAEDRMDFDALAYWEVRNLGQGDVAARREASTLLRQQQLRQLEALDQVAREISEAHAQVQARWRSLGPAEQGLRSAELSRKRNWERIQAGQGLPIEALQANVALDAAQRMYLRSIVDYNSAQFALQRALGYPTSATSPDAVRR